MTSATPSKPTGAAPSAGASKPRPLRRSPASVAKLAAGEQSREARQVAAALLEVLAGARTPTDAASALEVSLPRFYALEARALEGFLKACERRPRGPRRSAERELARLRREAERLEREVARYQALLRASQRAVGLRPPEPIGAKRGGTGKRRRRRRPVARALRAAGVLRSGGEGLEPAPAAQDTVEVAKA